MRKNRSDNRRTSGKSRLVMLLALAALMCLLVMPAAAYADSYPAQPTDWTVTFDGESLTSNFDASAIQKELQGMQPGDEATLTFTLVNGHSEAVDWWMENEIIKSLEDQSKVANGGAYTYEVTYTPAAGGSAQVLYSSDAVGGEQKTLPGMHEATDALKNYIWLEQIPANGQAKLVIHFALDGETQANVYQDTLGKLKVDFAVELPGKSGGSNGVIPMKAKTGDPANMTPWILAAAASLLALLLIFLWMRKDRKRGEA